MTWIAAWSALAPIAATILLLDFKVPGFTRAESPIASDPVLPTQRRGAG